jgi:hypothetical protein
MGNAHGECSYHKLVNDGVWHLNRKMFVMKYASGGERESIFGHSPREDGNALDDVIDEIVPHKKVIDKIEHCNGRMLKR